MQRDGSDTVSDDTLDAESRLTHYLLGQMDEEERSRLEEQYLVHPELHERLQAVERDLIDRYVRDELDDVGAFERGYLTSDARRQRVAFARNFAHAIEAPPLLESSSSVPHRLLSRPWWLAAAAALVIATSWLLWPTRPPAAVPTVAETPALSAPAIPPATPAPESTPPAVALPPFRVVTLVLQPAATRDGGELPTLALTNESEIGLELILETGGYDRYRATIRTPNGTVVWQGAPLVPRRSATGTALVVRLPAASLRAEDYMATVSGLDTNGVEDEVAGYAFRVVRR
jgi:hypothetical protein